MVKNSVFAALSFSILLISACSDDPSSDEPDVQDDVELTDESDDENEYEEVLGDIERFAGEDPEEWMRTEPGTYVGDDYDEQIILDTMEQVIHNGADDEEVFYTLLDLAAEDFRDYQAFLDGAEVDYSAASDRPDGEVDVEDEDNLQLNVQVLFDASGSMAASVSDGVKIDVAKDAVQDFLSEMPESTNVSLRVYGHKGSNQREGKEESCAGTEEVYPLSGYDEESFREALDQFEPTGYTPIAASIEAAQDDLAAQDDENVENIIYIVSDGEETCGGDPVQAAENLNGSDIEAVVNIIGFDVSEEEQEQLIEIANAGQGEYLPADSGEQLAQALREEQEALVSEWRDWSVENTEGNRSEQLEYEEQSREMESEMTELSREEQDNLSSILQTLTEASDKDLREVEDMIRNRGTELRSYMGDESRDFRREARQEGIDQRRETREESRDERSNVGDDDE
ncbi:VWA domain-containing protein [Geomicrobium sp. JCM 19039]|uniref:vWA domain-containing protein n=1 Tax=Geomicrobium sp. JCM 19039 TaxID=1460636 RepID=UPI00045F2986|nr:VWA domain-containing protein [Geomicrobium sp. JCM 19039]GAK13679.1 D-amino acid dehydrogenase large subunit [Geomicrobium sp. JCM 19039]